MKEINCMRTYSARLAIGMSKESHWLVSIYLQGFGLHMVFGRGGLKPKDLTRILWEP